MCLFVHPVLISFAKPKNTNASRSAYSALFVSPAATTVPDVTRGRAVTATAILCV